jgi:hypothetical protein
MVAGDLPAWAEEQQHHHHHHHHYHVHRSAKQQQEQHNGAAVDARPGQQGGCSSSSQYSGDDLVLPLEPAAMHRHTTPKDLKFPEKFSKVGSGRYDLRPFALECWLWQAPLSQRDLLLEQRSVSAANASLGRQKPECETWVAKVCM